MTFDLGSFMLGVGFALWWALLVTYTLWRVDKKDEDDVYAEYRKVLDAEKKEQGNETKI